MSCGAPSTSALSCAGEAWGNNSERLEDKLSTSLGSGEIVDLNFLPKRCTFVLRHEVESIIVSWVAWFENRKDGNVYLRSQNGWWLAGGVFLYFLWLASFLDSLCLQLSISIIGCDIWGDTSLFFFDLELFRNLRGTDKQLVFRQFFGVCGRKKIRKKKKKRKGEKEGKEKEKKGKNFRIQFK